MTAFEKLRYYMDSALDVSSKELTPVSEVIRRSLPDFIEGLRAVIVDSGATPGQKIQAVDLAFTAWTKCVKFGLQDERTAVLRDRAVAQRAEAIATKMAARAENKKHDLVIAAKRKRFARALAKATAKQEKK